MQIASLWLCKCHGIGPQGTVAVSGHESKFGKSYWENLFIHEVQKQSVRLRLSLSCEHQQVPPYQGRELVTIDTYVQMSDIVRTSEVTRTAYRRYHLLRELVRNSQQILIFGWITCNITNCFPTYPCMIYIYGDRTFLPKLIFHKLFIPHFKQFFPQFQLRIVIYKYS